MSKRFLLTSLAVLAFTGSSLAQAGCDGSPLPDYMHHIKDELRAVSSDIKSGDNQAAAEGVSKIITLFKKSREETPYLFKEENLQGAELAKKEKAYQGVVDDTIGVFKSLETALKANDMAQVKTLLGKVGQQRKIGHSSFKTSC
ncbi:hypothetical protein MSP8887_03138 [Marinomonas spartinae]|uniref:Cytochrome b562 n=1 Tax=Marinomonas spartinae TaxID=1792290 RepID=A0A1A8TLY2_9GAMM|nr:cytochrome b562 [Marinomonas spartinae]SBS33831.1 hypothetical protein MSP8886_02865 [Marinomonas spartinae]SBS38078.1 hypothetical protein MSP8887_03138 [Marinomonas spartinae]